MTYFDFSQNPLMTIKSLNCHFFVKFLGCRVGSGVSPPVICKHVYWFVEYQISAIL